MGDAQRCRSPMPKMSRQEEWPRRLYLQMVRSLKRIYRTSLNRADFKQVDELNAKARCQSFDRLKRWIGTTIFDEADRVLPDTDCLSKLVLRPAFIEAKA